ncbi:MAG: glycosyltransferase family 39 protein [Bryobacteraceae bacterium]
MHTESRPALPTWLYPSLLSAAILAYWLPRLLRGFWIDEAGAFWVAHGGWSNVWHTIQVWPTQSIVYAYLSTFFSSDGPYKEAVLRAPSVAGMLLATWALYKMTDAMLGAGSGWFAAIPFCCAGAIVDMATNARPYALGLGVVMVSFWSLRQLVHTGDRKWLVVYCVSSPLIIHFHYPFVVVFAVQAVYLYAAWRAGRRLRWTQLLIGVGAIMLGAVPLIWPFLTLAQVSTRWKTAALPTLSTFLSFYPLQVLFPAVIGLGLFFALYRKWFGPITSIPTDDLILLLTWLLLGPVAMFILARAGSYAIFATRFLIYALPPFFILLAWAIKQVGNAPGRFALIGSIAMSAALYVPQMAVTHEWRTPLAIAQGVAGPGTPILLRSGFVESPIFDWKSEPNPATHLFSPLLAYPVKNEIIPIPFFVDASAERYIEKQVERRAPTHAAFCLLAETGSDVLSVLPAWFHERGYRSYSQEVGGFELLLFRAPETVAQSTR